MKKLLRLTRIRLKVEKFLKEELWQHLIVVAFVLFCAWFYDRLYEAIMFMISHRFIRKPFKKQFHCKFTGTCLILTAAIAWFGISKSFPISISLLSTIPMCFLISLFGFIAQDRIDALIELRKLKNKTIWQMTEQELIDYCYCKGIRKECYIKFVIMAVKQISYSEIAKTLYVAESTLWDWSEFCRKKLNIKSFKIGR